MPIIWPTIDLSSRTTQQGLLTLAGKLLTLASGGCAYLSITYHMAVWKDVGLVSGGLLAIVGTVQAFISTHQGDAEK